jgi:hypothetical protein
MRTLTTIPLVVLGLFLVAAGSPSCPSQQWTASYSSPGFGEEEAGDMAVDAAGNTYVVGGSDSRAVIVKYDVNATQTWVRTYDAPNSFEDFGIAVAVDTAGNVYMTGGSNDETSSDAFTVKFDAAGTQQWASVWRAPRNTVAAGVDVAVDSSGNVLVLGITLEITDEEPDDFDDLFKFDYAVIRYTPAGAEDWSTTYNGSVRGLDFGVALAVDAAGNAIVVGATQTAAGNEPEIHMLTAKYSPSGTLLWQNRFGGNTEFSVGSAIEVDGLNNIYVTGVAGLDIVTVKYSPSGSQSWAARSPGGGGFGGLFGDAPADLAVDAQGNVVVTAPAGDAFATYRYNVTGQQQWLATYPAAGFDSAPIEVAMDPEGNAYVVGYADDHTHTIKYAPDGTQVWAQKLEAPVGPMEPVGIGVDAAHNVFIAGTSGGGFFSDAPAAIAAVRYSQGAP